MLNGYSHGDCPRRISLDDVGDNNPIRHESEHTGAQDLLQKCDALLPGSMAPSKFFKSMISSD
jgi:hypothetical protein